MGNKVQLSIQVTPELHKILKEIARERNTSVKGLFIESLRIMKAFKLQKEAGRHHMGFVSDRTKLDAELILLTG